MSNQIQERKKQILLQILNNLPKEWKIKEGKPPKESSTYRSVYLRYLFWKKRYPKELPDFKEIWILGLRNSPSSKNPLPSSKNRKNFWDFGEGKRAIFPNQ